MTTHDARVAQVFPYLQPGEPVLRAGLARWEELEARLGRHEGEGFIAVTDRRLVYVNGRRGRVSSIPYYIITDQRVESHRITADLTIETDPGEVISLNGAKSFIHFVEDAIRVARSFETSPPTPGTVVIFDRRLEILRCAACQTLVDVGSYYCSGCARIVEWVKCEVAVAEHEAAAAALEARRNERKRAEGKRAEGK
jgi:hypothetical protein